MGVKDLEFTEYHTINKVACDKCEWKGTTNELKSSICTETDEHGQPYSQYEGRCPKCNYRLL